MCLPPISVARSSRLQLLSLKPGIHSHVPLFSPFTPRLPAPLMSCPLQTPLPLRPFCLDSCHGLLAGLPASPSPSQVALLKPKSDQATWQPFLIGQGGLVTEASMASRRPPLAHFLLVALTGFLAVPPAPPTYPHSRASHSSSPHLPHVPAQEGPPDHPTLRFRPGFLS